jgi:hypothetical protein
LRRKNPPGFPYVSIDFCTAGLNSINQLGCRTFNEEAGNCVKSLFQRSSAVAKAKAARPSKVRSVGLACVLAITCAAGGYYIVKRNGKIEGKLASLMSLVKKGTVPPPSTKPAPETTPEPKHVEARAVKPADKVRLARLIKTAAEPKPSATPDAETEDKEQLPLSITLLAKDAFQAATEGQDNPNKVTLSIAFENLAGKPIRAFEGTLKFTDQLDKKIYSSKISARVEGWILGVG